MTRFRSQNWERLHPRSVALRHRGTLRMNSRGGDPATAAAIDPIAGGGNAALCAALTAREAGATVTVLECAPREYRGGNSRHTRNMRCMGDSYGEEEYWTDLLRVTDGQTDERLARIAIRSSSESMVWMKSHGARFQPALGVLLELIEGRHNLPSV